MAYRCFRIPDPQNGARAKYPADFAALTAKELTANSVARHQVRYARRLAVTPYFAGNGLSAAVWSRFCFRRSFHGHLCVYQLQLIHDISWRRDIYGKFELSSSKVRSPASNQISKLFDLPDRDLAGERSRETRSPCWMVSGLVKAGAVDTRGQNLTGSSTQLP